MPQFEACEPFDVGGLWFHVVPEENANSGKKHKKKGHMVLEVWRTEGRDPSGDWRPGRWIPIPMDVGFLLAEFFYHEEEFLYPRGQRGWMGGDKYMRYLWDAALKGWRHAAGNLELDKAGKADRISQPYRNHSSAWELRREWTATAHRDLTRDQPEGKEDEGS